MQMGSSTPFVSIADSPIHKPYHPVTKKNASNLPLNHLTCYRDGRYPCPHQTLEMSRTTIRTTAIVLFVCATPPQPPSPEHTHTQTQTTMQFQLVRLVIGWMEEERREVGFFWTVVLLAFRFLMVVVLRWWDGLWVSCIIFKLKSKQESISYI